MRDRQLANPRIAYKTVSFLHFKRHRDGDAPAIIRKCEIDGSWIFEVRIIL